ncbi:uncharacterized protein JCM15063_001939 [Sporobolomyces koalae]|uniref:uncharacterized protein n=1 Tax=Sporobolomyces koalae TaxID=500713 RepID=UPI0031733B1E
MATLPPELVLACLCQLDPDAAPTIPTLLSASLVSRAFRDISRSAVIWRPILYWAYVPRHGATKLDMTNPYEAYKARAEAGVRAKTLVRKLQVPRGRLPVMDELRTKLGPDVLDVLEQEHWTRRQREPDNWLSLAYWREEARRAILRDEAIETWQGIVERDERGQEDDSDFERGVNAFAAFRGFDPEYVCFHDCTLELFGLADCLRCLRLQNRPYYRMFISYAECEIMTMSRPEEPLERLRWTADQVCDYMSGIGLKPSEAGSFHNLNNHYVELSFIAADNPEVNHGTLPMTLVSIFCSFVRRIPHCEDIEVRPVGFPGTVLAAMRIRGESNEWSYVNPFAAARARHPTRAQLRSMLAALGTTEQSAFFRPASAREMCTRVSRNILTSIQTRQVNSQNEGIACLYSIAHSLLALTTPTSHLEGQDGDDAGFPNYVDWLVSIIQAEYPYDVPFLSQTVLPMLVEKTRTQDRVQDRERLEAVEALIESIEQEDKTDKEKKWVAGKIRWQIGHCFRHRLFGYYAVVRGWDYKCEASETWIMQMQVDRLPFGRDQPFYHVIVSDGSHRYVAQENITLEPAVPQNIIDRLCTDITIGKYFRKTERVEESEVPGSIAGEGEEAVREAYQGRIRFVKSLETEAEYPDG